MVQGAGHAAAPEDAEVHRLERHRPIEGGLWAANPHRDELCVTALAAHRSQQVTSRTRM